MAKAVGGGCLCTEPVGVPATPELKTLNFGKKTALLVGWVASKY